MVLLEVLLYDEAAHGVSDEHGLGTEHVDGTAYIVDIVGDGTRLQRLGQSAGTMAAQAHRDGTKTLVGKEVQEMLVPTPRGERRPVNEKQRRRMSVTARPFVDQFEHGSVPPIKIAATEW